jgi:sialate O-acetylesterase
VDDHKNIAQPFDRIAYFLELQQADGNTEYLYVSMDAFTGDLEKIGVPTLSPARIFNKTWRI